MAQTTFEEISAADFFYRNRDIAGFTNPSRAIFAAVRELVENSLDAAESLKIPPDVYVRLSYEGEASAETQIYRLRVEDNGIGIPARHIPSAFGQVLFGSKYKLKQQRGTFGLGGKMAILYGQITTHQPAYITSSTEMSKIYMYKLMIDIQRNRPLILDRKVLINKEQWRGTIVEFSLEGDYFRAMPKLLDYFKQTAMVNPYANLTFVDPKGRLYRFTRVTKEMPVPPKETKPHPYGVDVELLQRLIQITPYKNMLEFLKNHFHRVGEITAQKFLVFSNLSPSKNPKKLTHEEIVRLMHMLKKYEEFLPPDASCLSPLGEDLLKAGVLKELKPEFVVVHQRKPATYAGHPFIVEVGLAYGGEIPKRGNFIIYRFANRIPLLYDEASDVSVRVITAMNWRRYKVSPDMPVAILVHICSTKVPYKTVGKEFIADRPEVRREIANGLREVARQIQHFMSKREHVDRERKRLGVFSKYLPKIAQFSTQLAGKQKPPDIEKLLASVKKYGAEEA
ncbi:DNA topoisomerase VI subunit B [Candidatus Bathyarchaeota archaeon CG07_land_8_20_14_0_80_47_9]|nr:MAG: DNA topoisomerase VI subunit B [Candidatus Bathyarchaeota archaeon CG07_land_8_20_14_0_80_47_9]